MRCGIAAWDTSGGQLGFDGEGGQSICELDEGKVARFGGWVGSQRSGETGEVRGEGAVAEETWSGPF